MREVTDIVRKRSILLTTRMRFSPQLQPVKETAVDRIIEQILFVAPDEKALTLKEMQEVFSYESGGHTMNPSDMRASLERLVDNKHLVPTKKGNREFYRLSDQARQDIAALQASAEDRLDTVARRLFRNAKGGPAPYSAPFLKCLCIIFSKLGEESVLLIKRDTKETESLSYRSVVSAVKQVKNEFSSIDQGVLANAVETFFRDEDPQYDELKWNMAQNYYITKALGLDPSGILLSKQVFEHAVFYLDTNVIIQALEPRDRYHQSFLTLNEACKRLDVGLRICQISLDELRRWIGRQRELIAKVMDQVPEETESKVDSLFYEILCEKRESGEAVDFEQLFGSFESPVRDLKELFRVELEDDLWFEKAEDDPKVKQFAEELSLKYRDMHGWRKSSGVALHDAMLLFWVQKIREETDGNAQLITMDRSLPGSVPPGNSSESLAITLDALLQWISPVAVQGDEDQGFTAIFGKLIRQRLLPPERIFTLEDFLVFEEMQMSCGELPREDVEGCINYIKANAPNLDPSVPTDREKLAYEIAKFFVQPGRKYNQEIARLESEKIGAEEEYRKKLGEVSEQVLNLELEYKRDLEGYEKRLEERDQKIEAFEDKSRESEEKAKKKAFKKSGLKRVCMVGVIFILSEAVATYLACRWGEGNNTGQRICNSPFLFLVAGAFTVSLSWFIIGKDRFQALGWSFIRLFKSK